MYSIKLNDGSSAWQKDCQFEKYRQLRGAFFLPAVFPQKTRLLCGHCFFKTPLASWQHLTRLKMAQYLIAFRPHLTKKFLSRTHIENPNMREIIFSALHFGKGGGWLFSTYKYIGVTRFLKDLAGRKSMLVKVLFYPYRFQALTDIMTNNLKRCDGYWLLLCLSWFLYNYEL